MSILGKLFETKYCSICGSEIGLFGKTKLKNGICCKKCVSMFSPYFKGVKEATVDEIKYQIECRKENAEKLKEFNVTRVIGVDVKMLVDEEKQEFLIAKSKNFRSENLDVIEMAKVTNCYIDIEL